MSVKEEREMWKVAMVILLTLILVQSVNGQTFEVKAISEDIKQAVLRDTDTGEEWTVKKGDSVKGWRILEITREYITIVTPVEGGAVATRIPTRIKPKLPIQGR
jgi:hypothetical protein